MAENWYSVENVAELVSPRLLVYPDRIERNIKLMLQLSQGAEFLRPHVKTHKMAEIIEMQLQHGIYKFKCATIAEAELLAKTGAKDILLAMQPTGPNVSRFFELMSTYPGVSFSTLVDNAHTLKAMADRAKSEQVVAALWLDINNGMNRTGIRPSAKAAELYGQIAANPNLEARGLHVYDGHLRDSDSTVRKAKCDAAFETVLRLKKDIENLGMQVPALVAGGTPTFPIHGQRSGVEASPGTSLLWDYHYGTILPDLRFEPAAVLMTRVISKPQEGYICLDLGHKSVAPEMPLPRVHFLEESDFEQVGQSEEHLVVTTQNDDEHDVEDVCYAIPYHICPTVAKYSEVTAIRNHKVAATWQVAARNHKITI